MIEFYVVMGLIFATITFQLERPRSRADWLGLAGLTVLWPAFVIYVLIGVWRGR